MLTFEISFVKIEKNHSFLLLICKILDATKYFAYIVQMWAKIICFSNYGMQRLYHIFRKIFYVQEIQSKTLWSILVMKPWLHLDINFETLGFFCTFKHILVCYYFFVSYHCNQIIYCKMTKRTYSIYFKNRLTIYWLLIHFRLPQLTNVSS